MKIKFNKKFLKKTQTKINIEIKKISEIKAQ